VEGLVSRYMEKLSRHARRRPLGYGDLGRLLQREVAVAHRIVQLV
jgi:hypothetical protein